MPNALHKKPLNMLEAPVRPFIQKNGPRFVWAGRSKTIDMGKIVRDQETNTQSYDNSVLAVSRQENQYRYGQRSYFGIVNKAFRPPLIDPEYDTFPLSRMPRPRTQARTNPGGNGVIYHTQNSSDQDVSSHIDDRRLYGSIRPSFGLKRESPSDYAVEPDLEYHAPHNIWAHSREKCCELENERGEIRLNRTTPVVPVYAGVEPNVTFINNEGFDNIYLPSKTQGRNAHSNPSKSGFDMIDYNPQYTPITNRVSTGINSGTGTAPYVADNTPHQERNLRSTLGYVGSYDPYRSRGAVPPVVAERPEYKLRNPRGPRGLMASAQA